MAETTITIRRMTCDRCGYTADNPPDHERARWGTVSLEECGTYGWDNFIDTDRQPDLCPICMAQAKEWWQAPKNVMAQA